MPLHSCGESPCAGFMMELFCFVVVVFFSFEHFGPCMGGLFPLESVVILYGNTTFFFHLSAMDCTGQNTQNMEVE